MKNLLCIALFSFAMMANASNEKEVVTNVIDEKEILIENSFETESSDLNDEAFEDFVSCSDQGNLLYAQLTEAGMSHRDARSERRDFVRECRGGTWAWIGVCIGFIGHCDQ